MDFERKFPFWDINPRFKVRGLAEPEPEVRFAVWQKSAKPGPNRTAASLFEEEQAGQSATAGT